MSTKREVFTDFVTTLFEPAMLVFTVPLLLAVGLCLMAIVGLFDFDADADIDLDVDVDIDADLDADTDTHVGMGLGLLHALGVGRVPLSLLLVLLFFGFGLTGIVLHSAFGGLGWDVGLMNLAIIPASLIVGLTLMAFTARPLGRLFHSEGKAHRAASFVGKVAVLRSNSVNTTFGSAVVKVEGDYVELSVRSDTDDNALRYGDRVLLFDFDAERNLYLVTPYEEDDALRLPSPTL